MIGFEWLGSLTSMVDLITSLIPRRVQIPPTSRGVKFINMKRTIVLQPGNHWLWPFMSEVTVHAVMPRPVDLARIDVTNVEGIAFRVDASTLVSIHRDDESVIRAFVEHDEIETVIANECMNALCELVSASTSVELYDRDVFNLKFTRLIRRKLKRYGVRTHRAFIATLVTGRPILLVGTMNG